MTTLQAVVLAVLLIILVMILTCCAGGSPYNPDKFPIEAYVFCDFEEPISTRSNFAFVCDGTFSDPQCVSEGGIGASCRAAIGTTIPFVGDIGGSAHLNGRVETKDGFGAEVEACIIAGKFQRCVSAVTE